MNGSSSSTEHQPAPRTLVIAAFAAVYLIWGSTYLAIRVAVETLPPFLMAGTRFLLAGAALFVWLRLRGVAAPAKGQWKHNAITGLLLLFSGNGLVVWAEKSVSSSFAALFIAMVPFWITLLDWLRPHGHRPGVKSLTGVIIGFLGVVLLIHRPNAGDAGESVSLLGFGALLIACISWAAGSLYGRYRLSHDAPLMNSAVQMMAGGAGLLVLSVLNGEPAHFHFQQASGRSWLAMLYLVVAGSWIAFSAYVWLIKVTTPARVATYAYVNPVIAVLLGWWLLGERLTASSLVGAAIILTGVVIITLPASVVTNAVGWLRLRWKLT